MHPTPHRRRWFQISLRTLLILVTLAACGFGWLGFKIRMIREQQESVAELRKLNWMVYYDYQVDSQGSFVSAASLPGPVWLREWLGVDSVAKVVSVYSVGPAIADADMFRLQRLTHLQYLGLNDTQITDGALARLSGLSRLKYLGLNQSRITDAGLVHLRGLTRLEQLVLGNAEISDAGLVHLQDLTQLEVLNLHSTAITDAGLVHLRGLRRLKYLYLYDTQVTDAGLEHLKNLTQLQYLSLLNTRVTEAGIEELQKALPNLQMIPSQSR